MKNTYSPSFKEFNLQKDCDDLFDSLSLSII